MSLEKKLGFLDRFKVSFAASRAAYALSVGLALAPFYGCDQSNEPEEENQRYSCQMNSCALDPNGPYAVSDCNYECGEDDGNGNKPPMDYLTATKNGMPICPLGWTRGIHSDASAGSIIIYGQCVGDQIQMVYGPTPLPGGSAPCIEMQEEAFEGKQCSSESSPVSGQATITGSMGDLRVSGSCACSTAENAYSAEFSLPLNVL